MRGRLHQVAFVLTLLYGIFLVIYAPRFWPKVAMVIYTLGVAGMFGSSTLLHRGKWSLKAHKRIRRLDHSMIFMAIAGTYTGLGSLVLPPISRTVMLCLVWGGAFIGIGLRLGWMNAPRWAVITPYVAVGWVALGALPGLYHALGVTGFTLMAFGGLIYTLGAVVYAKKKPDPWPKVFGFHEVFHACTVVAATLFAIDVGAIVLPLVSTHHF
ncbi:MAG: hemolysin III family protein [Acidimicrobiales bacterium]|nr:hemolysin III family protein [Acidimicrobiales bacterium]